MLAFRSDGRLFFCCFSDVFRHDLYEQALQAEITKAKASKQLGSMQHMMPHAASDHQLRAGRS